MNKLRSILIKYLLLYISTLVLSLLLNMILPYKISGGSYSVLNLSSNIIAYLPGVIIAICIYIDLCRKKCWLLISILSLFMPINGIIFYLVKEFSTEKLNIKDDSMKKYLQKYALILILSFIVTTLINVILKYGIDLNDIEPTKHLIINTLSIVITLILNTIVAYIMSLDLLKLNLKSKLTLLLTVLISPLGITLFLFHCMDKLNNKCSSPFKQDT